MLKHKDTIDKWAKSMRHKLHVGDKCPVCQQVVQAIPPTEAVLMEMYNEVNNKYNEAKRLYDEQSQLYNKFEAEVKAEEKSYNTNRLAHDNDKTVAEAQSNALKACLKCGIPTISGDIHQQLDAIRLANEQKRDTLKASIAKGETINDALKAIRKTLSAQKTCIEKVLQPTFDKSKSEKEKCEKDMENALTIINTTKETLEKYQGYQQAKTTLETEMRQLEQPLHVSRFNSLSGEVASTLALLNKANETARDAQEAISSFVNSHPDIDITRLEELYLLNSSFINALNNDCEQARRDLQQYHTLLANINLRIKNHLAEEISSSISEEDTVDTLTAIHSQLSEDISMLNQNYGAKKKTLDDDKIKKSGAEELRQKAEEARK